MKHLAALPCLAASLVALATLTPAARGESASQTSAPITAAGLGAAAGAQYHGDGLSVTATPEGARLRCVFQKLEGQVTREGLWLTSTAENANGERFRIRAVSVGRTDESGFGALPETGVVTVADKLARFIRPGVTEVYSVSVNGVRQDFVVTQRPAGDGALRVELDVTGAKADALANGARLVLDGSGRKIAYTRLHVVDAAGKELSARMEVVSGILPDVGGGHPAATRLAVLVDDAAAKYPVRIDPTFSDANWVSLVGSLGASDAVYAMVMDFNSGSLYIGGSFTVVGTAVATGVAKWNGSAWSGLEPGLGGTVRALALDGAGNVYAGGAFTNAGLMATNIARWDGSAWSGLGGAIQRPVLSLAADGSGNVYAGGAFTNASIMATNIVRWQAGTWYALGPGLNATVFALAVDTAGTLYAGGSFTNSGSTAVKYIAQWNGFGWSALGSGMNGSVRALAVDTGGDVYAGGFFTTADGGSANRVARWNGFGWSPLGLGVNNAILALALDNSGNLCAGGFFSTAGGAPANTVALWNGSNWSALGSGVGQIMYAVAADAAGHFYAGGSFSTAAGIPVSNLAVWNGSVWSAIGLGMNWSSVVYAVDLDATGNLYVGGNFIMAGGVQATNIAKWDGIAWSALGSGIIGYVYALATDRSGNLYAAGRFTSAGGIAATNIAKWDGTAWSALGSGLTGGYTDAECLAVDSADNLYAGGLFTTAGGVTVNGIAKWNGSVWSALGSGISGGNAEVSGLTFDRASNLYVGGSFTTAGSVSANSVAKWNGSAWSALGSGIGGSGSWNGVTELVVDAAEHLFVGGSFTNAGGIPANNIAKWDGTAWSALGSGVAAVGGYICLYALALDPAQNLYAGGTFTNAGGVPAKFIAKWDGTAWSPLGAGMNQPVLSLAADQAGRLYVGGIFTTAGTNASAYVAQANVLSMISRPARNSDGSFTFDLLTTPNATNRVLVASNLGPLATWQPIWTNKAPANGAWQFTDTNASHYPARFYRSSTP